MSLHIPDEILHHILRYLVPKLSPRLGVECYVYYDPSLRATDLSSLCLVSRRFREIAQPLLYHTINITYKTIWKDLAEGHQLEWPGVLLRTLVENPNLAKHIRVLAIGSFSPGEMPEIDFPWDVPQSLRYALKHEFMGNSIHALSLAILFYATMVEKIALFSNDPDGIEIYWIVSAWFPQGNPPYDHADIDPNLTPELGPFANYGHPRLKEVYLDQYDDERCFLDRVFVDIMKKPGLSTLCTNGGWWFEELFDEPQLPAGVPSDNWPSSLRVLKMKNCYINSNSFAYILKNCPYLQTLDIHLAKYEWMGRNNVIWTVDLDKIGQALRDHGSSLTSVSFHAFNFRLSHQPIGRIGPLRTMRSLQHLSFSMNEVIMSQEWALESILPVSIVTIYISYKEPNIALSTPSSVVFAEIESILSSGRLRFLERVEVERYIHNSPDELTLFQTKIPDWSVSCRRKMCTEQDGVSEFMSITRFEASKSDSFNSFEE